MIGSACIAQFATREELDEWLRTDPYVTEGVWQDIDVMQPAKTSMMPNGLLDTLQEDEALDLMAFLISRGDQNHAMFQ